MTNTITVRDCLKAACVVCDVPEMEMVGGRRHPDIARPRQLFYFLARELASDKSWKQIATVACRDHTTIIHGYKRADNLLENSEDFRDKYMSALAVIANRDVIAASNP